MLCFCNAPLRMDHVDRGMVEGHSWPGTTIQQMAKSGEEGAQAVSRSRSSTAFSSEAFVEQSRTGQRSRANGFHAQARAGKPQLPPLEKTILQSPRLMEALERVRSQAQLRPRNSIQWTQEFVGACARVWPEAQENLPRRGPVARWRESSSCTEGGVEEGPGSQPSGTTTHIARAICCRFGFFAFRI